MASASRILSSPNCSTMRSSRSRCSRFMVGYGLMSGLESSFDLEDRLPRSIDRSVRMLGLLTLEADDRDPRLRLEQIDGRPDLAFQVDPGGMEFVIVESREHLRILTE